MEKHLAELKAIEKWDLPKVTFVEVRPRAGDWLVPADIRIKKATGHYYLFTVV
jgi:hypothetical protein